jgi:hypothetical protein
MNQKIVLWRRSLVWMAKWTSTGHRKDSGQHQDDNSKTKRTSTEIS